MLYGPLLLIIDASLWGIASYLLFVIISPNQKRPHIAALISAAFYYFWDEVIGSGVLSGFGVRFTNLDIARLVGDTFAKLTISEFLLSICLAYGGFFVGRYLFRRAMAAYNNRIMPDALKQPPSMQKEFTPEPKNEKEDNMSEKIIQSEPIPNNQTTIPVNESATPLKKKKAGLATVSLILSICGLAYPASILFFATIAGIICGHIASHRIRITPNLYTGIIRARAGLIIGYIALALGSTLIYLRISVAHSL